MFYNLSRFSIREETSAALRIALSSAWKAVGGLPQGKPSVLRFMCGLYEKDSRYKVSYHLVHSGLFFVLGMSSSSRAGSAIRKCHLVNELSKVMSVTSPNRCAYTVPYFRANIADTKPRFGHFSF